MPALITIFRKGFDIEDMRKTLAQRKQEFHALQYQYNAYAAKLAEFKQTHPVD